MSLLHAYLVSARIGHVEGLGKLNSETLEAITYLCRNLSGSSNFRLVVVRSLNKSCEARTIGDVDFVLLDTQIQVCFSTLTQCMRVGAPITDIFSYLCKLIAEEGVLLLDAKTVALGYDNFCRLNKNRKVPSNLPFNPDTKYSGLSDLFLAIHECTHYMLHHRRESEFASIVQWAVNDDRGPDWRLTTKETFPEAFESDLAFNSYADSVERQESFILENRDKLKFELACDFHALIVLHFWCTRSDVPPFEAFRSAWLCLKHMRLLQSIRRCAFEISSGLHVTGVDDHVRLLDVRVWRLLNFFYNTLPRLDTSVDATTLGRELISLGKRYYEGIEQPLASLVIPYFQNATMKNSQPPMSLVERFEFCFAAATKFGWRPRASTFEYVAL